jgi:RHS repeat-associated protein
MRKQLFAGALLLLVTAAPAYAAGPFDDTLVQAPTLTAPAWGSVVGSLAQLVVGPADLARGALQMPSPFAAPYGRGRLLAPVFPSYAADAGQSEWGLGWRADLAIRRFRVVGEIDYAADDFASPWGRLQRGDDGNYYPAGLGKLVRLSYDPADAGTWRALQPDGTTWTFLPADAVTTGRGSYAWMLSSVTTIEGERTELAWDRNASGRPFLARVRWGGRGAQRQLELELVYASVPMPFEDEKAGVPLLLDRRVSEVRLGERHPVTGELAPRWKWILGYTEGLTGPAFYLSSVQRVFASGAAEPPVSYEYDLGGLLGDGTLLPLPELDPLLATYGTNAISPEKASYVDLDQDGVTEVEHSDSVTLWRKSGASWSAEMLPLPTGAEEPLCRRAPGTANPPRQFARLGAGAAPWRVVAARASGGHTRFAVCDRSGLLISEANLDGSWAPGPLTRLADLDHDLQPDLVRLNPGSVDVFHNAGAPDTLELQAQPRQFLTPRFAASAAWVEDQNGDGVADLIGRAPNGFVVWLGQGQGRFLPTGRVFPLVGADGRRLSDISGFSVTWLDANRDGLLDLTLTFGRNVKLYTNSGTSFVERDVRALRNLGTQLGLPVAVDLSTRGESEVVMVFDGHAQALAFTQPSNGLLVRADDGKGTEVRLAWDRAPAAPGLGQRPPVLAALTTSSTGQPAATWYYDYEAPRAHSLARILLGYGHVRRAGPLLGEDVELHHDDDVSGVVLGTITTDARTPGVYRFERHDFEERRFHGVRWWRGSGDTRGWRRLDGTGELATRVEELGFEREHCSTRTRTTTSHGVLEVERTLAHVTGLPDELHCLAAAEHLHGAHADASLDFDHAVQIDRDALGGVTEIRSLGDGSAFALERVSYDAEHRVATVTQPGGAVTTAEWEPGTGRLRALTRPDGVRAESTLDPLSDALLSWREDHDGAAVVSSWRYDGLERPARAWDDQGGASEAAPISQASYRYAGAGKPAALRVRTRLSAGAARESVTLSSAAGAPLAESTHGAEGWSFARLAAPDPALRSSEAFARGASAGDPFDLSVAALYDGALSLSASQASGFDDPVFARTLEQRGVTRVQTGARQLVDGELVITQVENGTYATRRGSDADGAVTWRADALGHLTRLRYDALGRLVGVTLPGGEQHERRFDGHGRPAEIRRTGVGRVVYGYDAASGLPAEKRFYDADGALVRTESSRRDAIGRVVETSHTRADGAASVVSFEYDGGVGPGAVPGQRGQLTGVRGDGFAKEMRYRPDGKLASRSVALTGWRTLEEAFVYYDDGSLATHERRVLDASGRELDRVVEEHAVDAYGRLATLAFDDIDAIRLRYDGEGRLAAARFDDGVLLDWRRDPDTRRVVGFDEDAPDLLMSGSVDWSYGARGLTESETYSFGAVPELHRYLHDPRGFLASVDAGARSASYTYDASGRPLHASDEDGDRPIARDGRRLVAGSHDYELDGAGRVVRRDDLSLAYGPDGQLASATRGARSWSYLHDESGVRLARVENGRPVAAWLGGGYLDEAGFVLPVTIEGRVVAAVTGGRLLSLLTDARGTVVHAEEDVASVPTPYGLRSVHPRLAAAVDFATRGYDAELGVVRMGVRDYDPLLGEFWTPDPLYLEDLDRAGTSPVNANLYAYAGNAPLDLVDPSGQEPTPAELEQACGCSRNGASTVPSAPSPPAAPEPPSPTPGPAPEPVQRHDVGASHPIVVWDPHAGAGGSSGFTPQAPPSEHDLAVNEGERAVFWEAASFHPVGFVVNIDYDAANALKAAINMDGHGVKLGVVNVGLDLAGKVVPQIGAWQIGTDVAATGYRMAGWSAKDAPLASDLVLEGAEGIASDIADYFEKNAPTPPEHTTPHCGSPSCI